MSSRRSLLLLAFVLPVAAASLVSSSARVDVADKAPAETVWYGWQTLTTDAASLALAGLSLASDGPGSERVFGVTAASAFVLGAPIVHAAHGNLGRGVGSLALRVGMPALGLVVGVLVGSALPTSNTGTFSDLDNAVSNIAYGVLVGTLVGAAGASAIDAGALAREKLPATSREASASRGALRPLQMTPTFAVARERGDTPGTRAVVGVAATF
jgi:hypothetical protein